MKKLLSLLVITLILTLTITSCTAIKGAFVKCEVKFDLDGGVAGEGFIESVTVKYGKTVAMSTPTRENFTFEGWYDGDTLYTEETPITKDVTLRAKWTFNNTYTLTFETNGMADVPASHPVIGELPKIPAAPQVEGYVFAGWYFDAEYTTRYFFDYPLSEATTLYAKFYDLSLGEYIVISNVEQLMAIKDDPTAKYLLACDINCKGETLAPINEFSGEIEGNGYKIHNFSINETSDKVGFILTNKGTVQNLSFSDFTFDILNNNAANKYYGMVAAINEGSIINCHLLDSQIKIDMTVSVKSGSSDTFNAYIGAIVGYNYSEIANCTNKSSINVFSFCDAIARDNGAYSNLLFVSKIGGIVGENDKNASLTNSHNIGNIFNLSKYSGHHYIGEKIGKQYPYIGGVIGSNEGSIANCYNSGDISVEMNRVNTYTYADVKIGGTAGNNHGEIINSYSKGNINYKGASNIVSLGGFVAYNLGEINNSYNITNIVSESTATSIGGFTAYNQGKIYNCYATTNIVSKSSVTSVGGFVAENKLVSGYPATINKCFAMGNITLSNAPTNSGYFVGTNSGTIKDSYYADTLAINKVVVTENENGESVETLEAIEVTNTIGEAKAESELLSVDFLENTLYFDRMVWFLVDGKLPELR